MKRLIVFAALLFSCNCATKPKADAGNPYAYSGMSAFECNVICSSYLYPPAGQVDDAGRCWCDESQCGNSKNHGGCEPCNRLKGCQ